MKMEKRQMRYNYSVRKEAIRYVVIHDTGNPDKGADADAQFAGTLTTATGGAARISL